MRPVMHDIATIQATSTRKIALENVPRDSCAQLRSTRLVCGKEASV